MPNAGFVVFSGSGDPGNLFRKAFGDSWDQLGSDLVLRVPTQDEWDVALVWEPDGGSYEDDDRRMIQKRLAYLKKASSDVRCVGMILHEGSTRLHDSQRTLIQELLGDLRPHEVTYSHQTANLIYQAVADVIQQKNAGPAAYQEALRKLFTLVRSPYDLALDILMAFLPADLEWQITTGQNANAYLPQQSEMRAKYDRFKQLAGEFGATSEAFKETNTHFEQIFQYLPKDPQGFHKTYEELRDALLAIVEAMEQRGGGNPA
jgi:hypothetical protein